MAFDGKSLDDYIDVAQRIADFRERYPEGCLRPVDPAKPWEQATVTGYDKDGREITQTFIVYVAAAYRNADDAMPGIGMAWEVFPGRTPYTRGSELMNSETSAWGRAIVAVLASDSKRGVASREEVRNRQAEGEWSMTAEQKAEHTALRRGVAGRTPAAERARVERSDRVPADDPWYDQPAPEPVDGDSPGTISKRQQDAMHAAFTQLGIKDRAERLAWSEDALKLPIGSLGSSSVLSFRQAARLLEALHDAAKAPADAS